jgi:hypothetical protein
VNELAKVSRFEVIDHRENGEGRVLVARGNNLKVETSLQDSDRTLKVFITDTKAPIPVNRSEVNQLYAYNLLRESVKDSDPQLDSIIKNLGAYINGGVK